jgi:16S rRNA (uracil1498-N3)-methyltransferase
MPENTPHAPPLPYAALRYDAPIKVGQKLRLNRVMVRALRFREINPSEAFTVQDSEGRFFRAQFLGSTAQAGEAQAYEQMARSPESPLRATLVQAVLARQRMLEVIRKATELGADRVIPVFTEQSVGPDGLEHEKAHAWPRNALRASRQTRRSSVPEVRETVPLADLLADPVWTEADLRVYMDDRARESVALPSSAENVVLAGGPEGGWTDAEREALRRAGAVPLVIGGRVLRAETAPIVGLALLQHRYGDL